MKTLRDKVAAYCQDDRQVRRSYEVADEIIALVRGDGEPVAWLHRYSIRRPVDLRSEPLGDVVKECGEYIETRPLYLAPPPVEVTEEQIALVSMTLGINPTRENVRSALRAAGIKVKESNTKGR